MSPITVDQVRRALQAALDDDDAQSPTLTLELLDMMISAAVDRELDRRREARWNGCSELASSLASSPVQPFS